MKTLRSISAALGVAVVVAACGAQPAASDRVGEAKCQVEPPSKPVEVNLYGWSFEVMDFYAEVLKSCSSVENIDVNATLTDSDTVNTQVPLALSGSGDSPYDIVHGANPEINYWALEGWLLPLDDLIEKYKDEYNLDDISPAAWETSTIDGKVYGIPLDTNTMNLAYRKDLFDKYDIAIPTTYDEVIAACDVLKKDPEIDLPFTMDLSAGWAWELEFFTFLQSFGGKYLNDDGSPAFNSPQGVEAAEKLKDVADACMGASNLTNYGYEASESAMKTGAIAFTQIWAANTASMTDPKESNFADDIAFAVSPAPKAGSTVDGSAWNDFYMIPKNAKNDPDLLFRMIMEVASQKSQQSAAKLGIVTRTSIKQEIDDAAPALESIEKGPGGYPAEAGIPSAQAALGNYLPLIGSGKMTAQEALDAAAKTYASEATKKGYIK